MKNTQDIDGTMPTLNTNKPTPQSRASKRPSVRVQRMGSSKGFKVVCAYVYPWLESTKTFRTKEQARAELRRWQREAADEGQQIIGRIAATARISCGEDEKP